MTHLGNLIRKRRKELNISLDGLAVSVGYKRHTSIVEIESGNKKLKKDKLYKIANILTLSKDDVKLALQKDFNEEIDRIMKAL